VLYSCCIECVVYRRIGYNGSLQLNDCNLAISSGEQHRRGTGVFTRGILGECHKSDSSAVIVDTNLIHGIWLIGDEISRRKLYSEVIERDLELTPSSVSAQSGHSSLIISDKPTQMLPSHSSSEMPVNSLQHVNTQEANSSIKPSSYQLLGTVKLRRVQRSIKKSTIRKPRSPHLPMIPMVLMDRSNHSSSASKPRPQCKHCLSSSTVLAQTRLLRYSRMEWEFMMNCALRYGLNQLRDLSLYSERQHMELLRQKGEAKSYTCRMSERGILNGDWSPIRVTRSISNHGLMEANWPIPRSSLRQKRRRSLYHSRQLAQPILRPCTRPYPPCCRLPASIRHYSQCPTCTTLSSLKSLSTPPSTR
jgi:hypothetical protein